MQKFYIYILWSDSAQKHYVGYTTDFEARLEQHNTSEHNTFTSKHRPWVAKALFECGTSRAEAMKIEKFIKAQKRKGFLESLIQSTEFFGPLEALVSVPHVRD